VDWNGCPCPVGTRAQVGRNTQLGTETSFDLQTCLTLLVILNESFERGATEEIISKKHVRAAIRRCLDKRRTMRNEGIPEKDARIDSLRHAMAHFNVTPDASGPGGDGVIVGLFLESKPPNGKQWRAYVQAKKLHQLVQELGQLWPES